MPIFRVKSVKIYTGQKNLHWQRQWRQWQLWGMSLATYNLNQWLRHEDILHRLHSCFNYPPLFLVITISDVTSSGNQSYFAFFLEMGWPFLLGSLFHIWKCFYISRPIHHRKNMRFGRHQKIAALQRWRHLDLWGQSQRGGWGDQQLQISNLNIVSQTPSM